MQSARRCQIVFPTLVGVFPVVAPGGISIAVFPTLVGVFLTCRKRSRAASRLPHARGGVSMEIKTLDPERAVFPTLVGVFHRQNQMAGFGLVFPTLVGVFPKTL